MTPQQIVEKARELPARKRNAAAKVWDIAYGDLLARIPRKGLKVFEVHHIIARAREAFLRELVAGKGLDDCRAAALAVAKSEG